MGLMGGVGVRNWCSALASVVDLWGRRVRLTRGADVYVGVGLNGGTGGDMIKYKPHIISHHINDLVQEQGFSYTIFHF